MAPVVITGVQGLLNQQGAEAGTIDKQISAMHVTIFHCDRGHKAIHRVSLYTYNFSFGPDNTKFFTVFAKVFGIKTSVKVKCMTNIRHRRIWYIGARPHKFIFCTRQ